MTRTLRRRFVGHAPARACRPGARDDPDGQRHRPADPRSGAGYAAELAEGAGEGAPHLPARFATDVPDALIAEAGFSALVRVEKGGREHTLLFDTGVSSSGVTENMRRLGLSLHDVDETGFKGHEALRDGGWEPDPLILDDLALVLRVRDRGLLVLSGCGHAGIVNTVRYAQKLTGEQKIAAVIGGFHLSGPMFEPTIASTVRAFDELAPSFLMPSHCTGWKAVHQFAARYPEAFVPSTVGTTLEL